MERELGQGEQDAGAVAVKCVQDHLQLGRQSGNVARWTTRRDGWTEQLLQSCMLHQKVDIYSVDPKISVTRSRSEGAKIASDSRLQVCMCTGKELCV